MIETGAAAPDFSLADHFGRKLSLSQFRGKKHVMLLFYPADFTAT
jgi:peroxiredoxin Q/BCP